MPVPVVSPRNWKRTKIICHFRMGTDIALVDELSFEDQLTTVLDFDGAYTEEAHRVEEKNENRMGVQTHTDFQGSPDDPYTVRLGLPRSNPHRPEVGIETIKQLRSAVKSEKPAVPVEKLDFDDNLGILLDAAERYYAALQCEVA